jgi:hypothetical protein
MILEQLQALSDARFLRIYQALENQGFGPLDGEVARSLNFRPQAIRKVPMPQRARRARSILASKKNSEMCYELFGSYLIKEHRELVTGFLDATGVEHEDGMIEDLETNHPDAAKLPAAAADLDAKFPPEDVTLYLSMCAEQWPQVPELAKLWRERLAAEAPKG